MSRTLTDFIAHRVDALAYVTLTRRDDLVVTKIPDGSDLDLLVKMGSPGDRQLRWLGILHHGVSKSLSDDEASRELMTWFRQRGKESGVVQYPFPVIALIFSMENDEGFYAWRSRPTVNTDKMPILEPQKSPSCEPFTKGALDDIVTTVNEWYDSLFSLIAAA